MYYKFGAYSGLVDVVFVILEVGGHLGLIFVHLQQLGSRRSILWHLIITLANQPRESKGDPALRFNGADHSSVHWAEREICRLDLPDDLGLEVDITLHLRHIVLNTHVLRWT